MKFFLILLISLNAFGQASNPNDTLKLGDKNSASDKGLIFDTNDGVSNKTLKVNPASKYLIWSGNQLQIGDGASVNDKEFILDPASGASLKWNGADNYVELRTEKLRIGKDLNNDIALQFGKGGSNPQILYNSTKGKIQFSNDGAGFKDIGSGAGGGGGENFNNAFGPEDNGNAEDGTTGWTASAGSFVIDTADPLEGDQSFLWTPAAQNDTLDSAVLSVDKDVLRGNSCQANITYIGGDENLSLQVINGNNTVLSSLTLPAHSTSGVESIFFLCPNAAEITGDVEKGNLRLRLLNEGATASAQIKFDKSYLGTLIGLTETTLPDILSVRTSVGASPVISSQSPTWVNSITRTTTGVIRYFYQSGTFTEEPICWEGSLTTGINADTGCHVTEINLVSEYIEVACVQGGIGQVDIDRTLTCRKVGADAKQSVQVYKSIPKVSENVNEFSAKVDATGVVTNENTNWLDGDCNNPSAGRYECNYVSGLASEPMNCSVTSTRANVSIQNDTTFWVPTTSTGFTAQNIQRGTGSVIAGNGEFEVVCTKSGDDFKLPTVQPIIVGQVRNSAAETNSKNVTVESCVILNSGTPSIDASSGLCGWIQSLTDINTGNTLIDYTGAFSSPPVCTCSINLNIAGRDCVFNSVPTLNSVNVSTTDSNTSAFDRDVSVTCIGEK